MLSLAQSEDWYLFLFVLPPDPDLITRNFSVKNLSLASISIFSLPWNTKNIVTIKSSTYSVSYFLNLKFLTSSSCFVISSFLAFLPPKNTMHFHKCKRWNPRCKQDATTDKVTCFHRRNLCSYARKYILKQLQLHRTELTAELLREHSHTVMSPGQPGVTWQIWNYRVLIKTKSCFDPITSQSQLWLCWLTQPVLCISVSHSSDHTLQYSQDNKH